MRLPVVDLDARKVTRKVITGMEEHDLLTSASAIAFQVLTSLIPLALLVLSIMGFLKLDDVWTKDLAPQVKQQVSGPGLRGRSTTSRGTRWAASRAGG